MAKSCLGLDIGSYQIKIAELVREGKHNYRIKELLQFAPPEGSLNHDQLLDPDLFAYALRGALKERGVKTARGSGA